MEMLVLITIKLYLFILNTKIVSQNFLCLKNYVNVNVSFLMRENRLE